MSQIIAPPVNLSQLISQSQQIGFYTLEANTKGSYLTDYQVVRYSRSAGKLALPNTSTGMSIVNVAAPNGFMAVEFHKRRLNSPPVYPLAAPTDTNKVLLHEEVEIMTPTVMADMTTRVFEVWGFYLYALLTPLASGQDLPLGLMASENPLTIGQYAQQTPPLKAAAILGTGGLPANLVLPGVNAKQLF